MAEITYPFVYSENLNGLEVVSRGLKQQKKLNEKKEYQMTWDSDDDTALSKALSDGTDIRNNDFYVGPVYDGCIDNPPCPWDKSGNDNLTESNLMQLSFRRRMTPPTRSRLTKEKTTGQSPTH